jgi:hypothetical protein
MAFGKRSLSEHGRAGAELNGATLGQVFGTRSRTSMLLEPLRTRLTNGMGCPMALVGLVRVSTKAQETARQHDALDPICVKVFEEKMSGKLRTEDRPARGRPASPQPGP